MYWVNLRPWLYTLVNLTVLVTVWAMLWRQTEANHYHAQLGLLDKGHAIKEFVVY